MEAPQPEEERQRLVLDSLGLPHDYIFLRSSLSRNLEFTD